MEYDKIARYLDHAVLKPEFTREEAIREIQVGIDYEVRTVCVRPCDIELANDMCKGTETEVCCVLGFPHGCALSESKADEARRYVNLGVSEIDMVVNYGFVRSQMWSEVQLDIRAVTSIAKKEGVLVKVIFETSALGVEEIKKATEIAISAEADFVKTSTGFASGGATDEAVLAMLEAAQGRIQVKPSGGIRDLARAVTLLKMGATRLGVGSTTTPVICGGAEGGKASEGTY